MTCISNLNFVPLLFAVSYIIAWEIIAECPPECLVVQELSASATFILCLKRGLTSMQAQCKIYVEYLGFLILSRMSDRDPDFLSRGIYIWTPSPLSKCSPPDSARIDRLDLYQQHQLFHDAAFQKEEWRFYIVWVPIQSRGMQEAKWVPS